MLKLIKVIISLPFRSLIIDFFQSSHLNLYLIHFNLANFVLFFSHTLFILTHRALNSNIGPILGLILFQIMHFTSKFGKFQIAYTHKRGLVVI